jgi:hypothetical protein
MGVLNKAKMSLRMEFWGPVNGEVSANRSANALWPDGVSHYCSRSTVPTPTPSVLAILRTPTP